MKGYHFKIEKDGKFLVATCIELDGCHTQGRSMDDLNFNMVEALTVFLDEPLKSKHIFPDPKNIRKSKNVVEVFPEEMVWIKHQKRQSLLKSTNQQ